MIVRSTDLSEFGRVVRSLRMSHHISLKDMADALSMTCSQICAVEFGDSTLTEAQASSVDLFFLPIATNEEMRSLRLAMQQRGDCKRAGSTMPFIERLRNTP